MSDSEVSVTDSVELVATPAPDARVLVALVQIRVEQHIAFLDIPEAVVLEATDPTTLTLRNLPGGASYSLVPVDRDGPVIEALARVRHCLDKLRQPCPLLSVYHARVDNVIETCEGLFNSIEYIVVDTKEELEIMLNPRKNADHEFKKYKRDILGDLLARVKERAKDSPTSGTHLDPEASGHVHGPDCGDDCDE